MDGRAEFRWLLRRAFVDSLPVLMGYSTMGFVAGLLLAAKGGVAFAPFWALLSSALWVSGTMSYACVPHIASRESILLFAGLTLAINFRYAFYGFSMLSRWKGVPFWRKCYLILMLTDENYALEAACDICNPARNLRYCTLLSMLNHSYWIVGVTSGALLVCLLGTVLEAETIRRYTSGMEFAMVALFLVIFTDQVRGFLKNENGK